MIRKVSVIFVIGLFVLVSLSCSNPITNYFSTQTAVMETATATMWTPTPTYTPTNTPTNTPTDTPTASPTPDFLYSEDFDDPDSGWYEAEDDVVLFEYSDGGYRMKVKTPRIIARTLSPEEADYSDVKIEVDGTKIGGPKHSELGLIARYVDKNNFYVFLISTDGMAQIQKKENGTYSGISSKSMKSVDGINADTLNHIVAVCDGDKLELYANGNLVASATDDSFREGQIGLVVGTADLGGADILFDNLFVRPL